MHSAVKIFRFLYQKPTILLFLFLVFFTIDRYNRWVDYDKDKRPFVDDVDQFYSYLPALFIQHDLTFNYPNDYWTVTAPNGNKIARTTYGMAVMYSPFFFVGHLIAKRLNYAIDGYSLPYKWCIHAGTILYSLLGLWYCRKNLLHFFNEAVAALTLLTVFLGTNLFYYTYGWGEMAHSYLFFIISAFIFCVLKWFETDRSKYLYLFSFLAGFATLIRPTDIVILTFPILYGVGSASHLVERFKLFNRLKWKLFVSVSLFMFPIFLQLLYWKIYSGHWFIFTYGTGERFFFSDPQIFNFLFSFRKGWFIYTPVMFLILIGIPYFRKSAPSLFLFMVIYFFLNVYLLSSWWDWGFGGSFGCRAIIQHYAFFAFALASVISLAFGLFESNKKLRIAIRTTICVVLFFLIKLNYDQSWLYKYGLIDPFGMTKEAYYYVFNKTGINKIDAKVFKQKIKEPDFEAMLKGKRDQ